MAVVVLGRNLWRGFSVSSSGRSTAILVWVMSNLDMCSSLLNEALLGRLKAMRVPLVGYAIYPGLVDSLQRVPGWGSGLEVQPAMPVASRFESLVTRPTGSRCRRSRSEAHLPTIRQRRAKSDRRPDASDRSRNRLAIAGHPGDVGEQFERLRRSSASKPNFAEGSGQFVQDGLRAWDEFQSFVGSFLDRDREGHPR